MKDVIYLDNAATSMPKPPEVARAMMRFLTDVGANPGRSGHRLSIDAGRVVYDAREAIATLFNAPDALRVVFGHNITEALNFALMGLLKAGDHVITTSMEHNSVMRPLRFLAQHGVELSIIPCDAQGKLDAQAIEDAIRPHTAMIVVNHASNVVGTLTPITEIGAIARQHGILFMVDTAQTAGAYPIDMQADHIDLLAFTGHKALMGPTGTGGLIVGDNVDVGRFVPLKRGGTGSHSELEEQPTFLPDMGESGTPNSVGLAGLEAGVQWVMARGVEAIRAEEVRLTQRLIDGLLAVAGVTVYGTHDARLQVATLSFNVAGMSASDVGYQLDEDYNIMARVGLHCSPSAHRTIGTFPHGTVRFALSAFTTADEVDSAIHAVAQLAQSVRHSS